MNPDPRYLELLQRLDGTALHRLSGESLSREVRDECDARRQSASDSKETSAPAGRDAGLDSLEHDALESDRIKLDPINLDEVQLDELTRLAERSANWDRRIANALQSPTEPTSADEDRRERLKAALQTARGQQPGNTNTSVVAEASAEASAEACDDASGESSAHHQAVCWARVLSSEAPADGEDTARLAESQSVAANATLSELPSASDLESSRRFANFSRRKLFVYASIVAISIVSLTGIGIAIVRLNQTPEVIARNRVVQEVTEWKSAVDRQAWNASPESKMDNYPINVDINPRPTGWMTIETRYDRQTVVYNLTPPGQKQVLQFTFRTNRQFDLDRILPTEPIYETGSYCVGACYVDGILYVIFVEGDADRYREVIRFRNDLA